MQSLLPELDEYKYEKSMDEVTLDLWGVVQKLDLCGHCNSYIHDYIEIKISQLQQIKTEVSDL